MSDRGLTRGEFLASLVGIAGVAACGSDTKPPTATGTPAPTRARFAVISDPHVYDAATLGNGNAALGSGDALNQYIAGDRKMIRQSAALLDAALAALAKQELDFLLVSGDLTKDGEEASHRLLVARTAALRGAGVKVYVVPGNHDVNNPSACAYPSDGSRAATAAVTPAAFRSIHAELGYGAAIDQDPASLSYVAEPVAGVWVLAIDSCKYEDNTALGAPQTSGAIRSATLAWIQQVLAKAQSAGKRVVAMQHHGVVEHYAGQSAFFPEYLVDGFGAIGQAYAGAGLKVVFTGHYHANDAATGAGGALTDVETGSLVTSPSPYRLVDLELATGALDVHTFHVTAIDAAAYPSAQYASFNAYARQFLLNGMIDLSKAMLLSTFGSAVDATTAGLVAPFLADAMVAHYAGDESMPAVEASAIQTLVTNLTTAGAPQTVVAQLSAILQGLWTDLSPADNDLALTVG